MNVDRGYIWYWLRWLMPLFMAAGVFLLCRYEIVTASAVLEVLGKGAFVITGFIVSAFNLRFRILDTVQKDILNHSQLIATIALYKRCQHRLDIWTIWFVVAAVLCAAAPMVVGREQISEIAAPLLWAVFGSTGVGFVAILRSFRDLESAILKRFVTIKEARVREELEAGAIEAVKILPKSDAPNGSEENRSG